MAVMSCRVLACLSFVQKRMKAKRALARMSAAAGTADGGLRQVSPRGHEGDECSPCLAREEEWEAGSAAEAGDASGSVGFVAGGSGGTGSSRGSGLCLEGRMRLRGALARAGEAKGETWCGSVSREVE